LCRIPSARSPAHDTTAYTAVSGGCGDNTPKDPRVVSKNSTKEAEIPKSQALELRHIVILFLFAF
jgi:hypothetical protein